MTEKYATTYQTKLRNGDDWQEDIEILSDKEDRSEWSMYFIWIILDGEGGEEEHGRNCRKPSEMTGDVRLL